MVIVNRMDTVVFKLRYDVGVWFFEVPLTSRNFEGVRNETLNVLKNIFLSFNGFYSLDRVKISALFQKPWVDLMPSLGGQRRVDAKLSIEKSSFDSFYKKFQQLG